MKAQGIFFAAALLVFSATAAFPAAAGPADLQAMYAQARTEIASFGKKEADPGSLGEWTSVVESTLFMLFRRTELYRGRIRVLVVEQDSVAVKMYPDGTFLLSTGLLDYIDTTLFEAASESPRRMRNFDSEREASLVPYLVHEAAHFALDHTLTAYARNTSAGGISVKDPFRFNAAEILEADRFSPVLLSLAGYDPVLCDAWLSMLGETYSAVPVPPVFSGYLADLPSPAVRLETIAGSRDNLAKITAEFQSVISGLRSGQALNEASDSLEALGETYPAASWIDRLDAIVAHRLWLATVPASGQRLKTFFPVSTEDDPTTKAFLDLFNEKSPAFPSPVTGTKNGKIPGDAELYAAALEAYRKASATHPESGLESCFAMALIWSDEITALRMGETAAAAKDGADFTARANYASLLYLTGTDYPRAQFMLDTLGDTAATARVPDAHSAFELDRGTPGDERDLLLNSALMLRSLGDQKRSIAKLEKFNSLGLPAAIRGSIALRQITVGDTADDLLSRWGRPAEILYNYVTENWNYPSLSASVLLERDAVVPGRQVIRRIRFGSGSPLTPGGDVRAGDGRSSFESMFGKPAYSSGDFNVYMKNGNRISVFYLSDTIRNVTMGL